MGAGISSVPPANGTRGAWPDPRPNENEESEGLFINATDEEDERLDKAAVYRIVGSMHRLRRRRAHDYAEETAAIDELFDTTSDNDGTISMAELRAAVRLLVQEDGNIELDEEFRRRCGKTLADDETPIQLGPRYLPSLVKRGANPESLDDDGMSALCYAAADGQVESIRFLLSEYNDGMGVLDIDARCPKNNRTALWIACARGQREAVVYLLSKGADLDIAGEVSPRIAATPTRECLPYNVARLNGQEEIAGFLFSEAERRAADKMRVRNLRAGNISERIFREQTLPPEETGLIAIVPNIDEPTEDYGSAFSRDEESGIDAQLLMQNIPPSEGPLTPPLLEQKPFVTAE